MNQKKYLPLAALVMSAGLLCLNGTGVLASREVSDDTSKYNRAEKADSSPWPDLREVHAQLLERRSIPRTSPEEVIPPRDHAFTKDELSRLFGKLSPYLDTGSFTLNHLNQAPWNRPGSLFPGASGKPSYQRGDWEGLRREIEKRFASYEGDWALYVKDLSNQNTMEINEHSMESASLIKLFIAGTIYEQLELGNLEETDTIMEALNLMITVSDNESSNVLVRQLYDKEDESFQDGLDVVNDFILRHGFTNTRQVNGIADPSLWVSDGSINMTSPADCGKLLEMIYDRELVSHFNSFRFEVLLNKQEVNYKIPAGLPEDVHISHKTGEVDDTENDAAIIYTPYGDYIFCIMSTNLSDTGSAVDHIHEITALVYDYFTSAEESEPTVLSEKEE